MIITPKSEILHCAEASGFTVSKENETIFFHDEELSSKLFAFTHYLDKYYNEKYNACATNNFICSQELPTLLDNLIEKELLEINAAVSNMIVNDTEVEGQVIAIDTDTVTCNLTVSKDICIVLPNATHSALDKNDKVTLRTELVAGRRVPRLALVKEEIRSDIQELLTEFSYTECPECHTEIRQLNADYFRAVIGRLKHQLQTYLDGRYIILPSSSKMAEAMLRTSTAWLQQHDNELLTKLLTKPSHKYADSRTEFENFWVKEDWDMQVEEWACDTPVKFYSWISWETARKRFQD